MAKKDAPAVVQAEQLQTPFVRLLKPLVRLLIKSGLTFPALCDLLRELYVHVAEHDFALPGKEQTDSRVSLLTGIHRKEVARLRGAGAPVSEVPAVLSRTSKIIAYWLASPDFTDSHGAPRALKRLSERDGEASFEALVASVTKDVHPRAVLDEWLDRKLVTEDSNGWITLNEAGFIPRDDVVQQLYYFGRNLHDHNAAAAANVLGEEPPFLERSVHYDGLSKDLAQKLEHLSKERAIALLKEINKEAHKASNADSGGRWRWNFGVYVYREEMPQDPASDQEPASGKAKKHE